MSSSQRSKGMNAFLKINVTKKNSLHEFAIIFDRALAKQREEELKADHSTLEKKPKIKTLWIMEKHMSKIYTKEIFYLFQEELAASLVYNVVPIKDDRDEILYKVAACGTMESKRNVTYCKSKEKASCNCLMFEFKGIPCRHLLAYFKFMDLTELPSEYILRRWAQDVKKGFTIDNDGNIIEDGARKNFTSNFLELTHLANILVDEAIFSDETFNLAAKRIHEIIVEMRLLKSGGNVEGVEPNEFKKGKRKDFSNVSVLEPKQAKTKGRRSGKRMKPGRENLKSRNRRCNGCGKRGQKHDIRNCPYIKESASVSQQSTDMLHKDSLREASEENYDDEDESDQASDN